MDSLRKRYRCTALTVLTGLTTIREFNFIGAGAGHKVLSSFRDMKQCPSSRGTITSEETAKLFDESKCISCYEVYRRPSPVVERPSRVRLRNIFIGRNYTYVHACTHVLSFFVYRSLSLSLFPSPPLSPSHEPDSYRTREQSGARIFGRMRVCTPRTLCLLFSRFRASFLCTAGGRDIAGS